MNDYYFTCTDDDQITLIQTLTKLGIVKVGGEGKDSTITAIDGAFYTTKDEFGMNISILRTKEDVLLKTETEKSKEDVVDTFSKNTSKFMVVEDGKAKLPIQPLVVFL